MLGHSFGQERPRRPKRLQRQLRRALPYSVSEASSLNPLNFYVVVSSNNNVAGGQTKDITPTINNSSNNDNVIVSKDGLESNSSVNKTGECNEASGAEVKTAENAYGVGEAVATVLLQPSEPPGSQPSGVLPEVACSSKPLGPRKVSSRKKRVARFNPMEGMAVVRQHFRTPFSRRSQKQ